MTILVGSSVLLDRLYCGVDDLLRFELININTAGRFNTLGRFVNRPHNLIIFDNGAGGTCPPRLSLVANRPQGDPASSMVATFDLVDALLSVS
jgi:hypothetical protein